MNSYGLPWRSCLPEILQQPVMKIRPLVVCGWLVGWLEFNVPFQHKYGYIRDEGGV